MSGSGICSRRRPVRVPPHFAAEDARAAERAAVVAYLTDQAAGVRRMAGRLTSARDRLGEDEAEQLARRIDAMAAGVSSGLHLAEVGQ